MLQKVVLTYLLFCSTFSLIATTYYVSPSGDDSQLGTTHAQAWQTLAKANGNMSAYQPGDSILFERGGTYRGFLQIYVSGTANHPIVFGAYGVGEKPILKASIALSSWTSLGGDVYKAACPTCPSRVNSLYINGVTKPIGRQPNATELNRGYRHIDSGVGKTQLTDLTLSYPDQYWTGAEVVIRNPRWILDKSKIIDFTNQTLILQDPVTDDIRPDYGYFFQNHPATFDLPGEWSFDDQTMEVYLYLPGGINPNAYNIEVSHLASNIVSSVVSHVHFHDLKLTGSQSAAIEAIQSHYMVYNNLHIYGAGKNGITLNGSDHVTFTRNLLEDINNNGIYHVSGEQGLFRFNTLRRIGIVAGMGSNGNGTHSAIWFKGDQNLFDENRIDSIGYIGFRFEGNNDTIKHNFISYACLTLDDGAAIYTWNDGSFVTAGNSIEGNIILNIQGTGEGTPEPYKKVAEGIYIDDRSYKMDIRKNTIGWCSDNSILIHNSESIDIRENTLFGGGVNQLYLLDDLIAGPNYPVEAVRVDSNIIVSTNAQAPVFHLRTYQDNLSDFGTFDYNQYCNPFDSMIFTRAWNPNSPVAGPLNEVQHTFSFFQAYTSQDLNAGETLVEYPAYRVTDTLGPERITNSTFGTDIAGWSCWGNYNNNCSLNRNTSRLDQGSLEIGFTTTNGSSYVEVYNHLGQIDSGKTYLLTFSGEGLVSRETVEINLQKDGSPYTYVVPPVKYPLDPRRKEYQYFFIPRVSESQTRLTVRITEQAQKFWIDNVSLREVAIDTLGNQFMDLLYNPTKTPKVVALSKSYIDPYGVSLCGSVTVPPFSSKVIFDVLNLPENPIYSGVDVTVENTKMLGCSWFNIISPIESDALVSINPNGLGLGFVDLTTYQHNGPVRTSSGFHILDRNWALSTENAPVGKFSIRLFVTQTEIDNLALVNPNVTSVKDLGVTRYTSSDPTTINGFFSDNQQGAINYFSPDQILYSPYQNGYYLEIAVDALGEFWISDQQITTGVSFPVDLLAFEAEQLNDRTSLLTWSTTSERNSSHFEVQKSLTTTFWEKAGSVPATGNSLSEKTYHFTDQLLIPYSGLIYYRLKEVNLNGTYTYSKVVAVQFNQTDEFHFALFPNPVEKEVTLTWQTPQSLPATVYIFNAMGQPVWEQQMPEFRNRHSLQVKDWPSGVYVLRFVTAGKVWVRTMVVK